MSNCRTCKPISWLVVLFLSFGSPSLAGPNEAAPSAAPTSESEAQFRSMLIHAEQGGAAAQVSVCLVYSLGTGVTQDPTEGAEWCRRAAEQDHANAQMLLGDMYKRGKGVPKDFVRAYMWLDLAASNGNGSAPGLLYGLSREMTRAEIAEARRLTYEWRRQRTR